MTITKNKMGIYGRGAKRYLGTVLMLSSLGCAALAAAEIYRWTDETGRVHFGDRPPQGIAAEDMSDTAKKINVDESRDERAKLGKIFAPETAEERRNREQKAQGMARQRAQQCQSAQKRLQQLEGRFIMRDESGKLFDVRESERKTMVEELKTQIRANC